MAEDVNCAALFGDADDVDLALKFCTVAPDGKCESVSVGSGSPGPVGDDEELYRILADPRDVDDGQILEAPFRTACTNGLSVVRSLATNEDCLRQTNDGMFNAPEQQRRSVEMVCVAQVGSVRHLEADDEKRQYFVYDQVVPLMRLEGAPVGTHAGVFARVPPKKTPGRKQRMKDLAGSLRKEFLKSVLGVGEFREGLLLQLNDRAMAGEFELRAED